MARTESRAAQVVARRPMGYAGREIDRGQVFELAGAPNDEKLTRLGYVAPLERGAETVTCAVCGATFTSGQLRTAHGDTRHRTRALTPQEEDAQAEREERLLDTVAPLYLENTKATAR